jgi:hypothetical protein
MSMTEQEKWDDQIERNRMKIFGLFRNRVAEEIADRMEECPNNPRLGGKGFSASRPR